MDKPIVLLVDDEAHITCVVAEKLRGAGYAVTTARDGEEGLELAARVHPALVITDLQMPRMSGLELALKLAATDYGRRTPVMMLTARGYILDRETVAKTNIKAVMGKPFSAREVVKAAAALISAGVVAARTEAA
jgi:DNA-binding response OmpR family regulator